MSGWRNYDEVISTLVSHDFIVSSLEVGKMQRVKRDGHEQKGWYSLHEITLDNGETALIGSFGYWFGGESFKEKIAPGKGIKLSAEQQAAIRAQHAEVTKRAEAKRNHDAEVAAKQATNAWTKYVPEGESSYLKRKAVQAFGLRFAPSGNGTVAIPMQDTNGKTWGLQIIRGKDRGNKLEKQYWPSGLNKKGHYHLIGGKPDAVLLIAEGYATCATLHQATGLPVAVAFDAYNLQPVALALHKKYQRTKILVCADDDYLTEGNPGCKAAEAAAIAVGGAWVKPSFETDREGKKLTDFNDLANYGAGTESTVMVQIEDKLAQLGWGLNAPSAPRAGAYKWGGGGERKAAVSVMEVEDLCERYIPIDDGTGEAVFDTWTNRVVGKKQMLALMPAGAKLDDIKRNYLWQSRGAFYLNDIGFDPTEKDTKVKLNLWTGWELKPKAGNTELLLSTLEYMCSKESNADELLWWIIKWMAYPLQHPGAKMASAVIMHGPQGTGKSLIFRTLAKIYGKYASVIGNSGIEDKFNADWSDSKLFILAEEIATSADKWQIKNELKELITGESVRVRAMHRIAYHQKNHMNIVFLSNEDLPIPIEQDDRRHCVVYTPPSLSKEHYTQVLEDLDNGGVEAFYDFLMNVDLTGFNRHTQPPQSQAKKNLISLSLPSDRRFIKEWSEGYLKQPICPCKSMSLYKAYISWCKVNGETRPRPSNQFLGMVTNLTGWVVDRKRFFDSTHYSGKLNQASVVIPSSEILNKNGYEKPFNKTEQQWLTDYILDFENANNDNQPEF